MFYPVLITMPMHGPWDDFAIVVNLSSEEAPCTRGFDSNMDFQDN